MANSRNLISVSVIDCDGPMDEKDLVAEKIEFASHEDPLEEAGADMNTPNVYRVTDVVFAEPIRSRNNIISDELSNYDNVKVIGNVIIKNRPGKRNKYFINTDDVSDLTCPQENCNKSFVTLVSLKAHIRKVHCADKRYICEKCGSAFTAQYLLKRHSAVHDSKKIQCPVCKKFLSPRTSLSTHLRSHADVRAHNCEICQKSFVRKSTMRRHIKFIHKEST